MLSPTARSEADALSDLQIIERVLAGDVDWFEVVMRRHNQRLFRAARAILRDDAEAEEVLQESYVSAYQHLATFEGRAQLSTWLTKIVVHAASAKLRVRKRQSPLDDEMEPEGALHDEPPGERPDEVLESRQLAGLAADAIDRLPLPFRTVFMLRAVEGLSGVETAACLGVPEDTVKTRLFRARAQIQKDLECRFDGGLGGVHRFLAERCDRVVVEVLARLQAAPAREAAADLGSAER
jgi:RNA polymerase sigma-70 factor (ECF subfamily)